MKKTFAVIGLGRFGSSVAKELTKVGYEVLAVDSDAVRVQEMSAIVTHCVQADSTDEDALKAIGIRNFDVVVVAIGENVQASILTTLILKDIGVPTLIVKAKNELHGKVLTKTGADKVIYPERDMGQRVAHSLISPNILDYIELSDNYSIVEIRATGRLVGKSLKELEIRARHQCNVMAIKNGHDMDITPDANALIKPTDILVVVGRNEDLIKFEKTYSE
ncbi:TrkA family potassium uptake protein [Paenibacillus aurantius]|uniref:TrkA family potassium uptake protein n=1 Tax=Paenibacillus aurantius TaxID=2918900 RepID=A0AA96LF10_9BACL|nr:TrkA family potassium uptake protein [Paenibacillus aurantius]WNQ12516.1 TrkA family potassium uptake protein [Paenibacillus aurantius]